MIRIGATEFVLSDPTVIAALIGAVFLLMVLVLLVMAVRRAGRSAALMSPLAHDMQAISQRVQSLSDGQQQLSGGLTHVSEAQAASQANMLKLMEQRMADVLFLRNPSI